MEVRDILTVSTDAIVAPNNSTLSASHGLAAKISEAAGARLSLDSSQLIREYGELLYGMAMSTSAGELPFKAIIHAVGPPMGVGDEQRLIEQVVSNSLLLCESNQWSSIAFPAISTGASAVPVRLCAKALARAVLRYWDARMDSLVEQVRFCVRQRHFAEFIASIDAENAGPLANVREHAMQLNNACSKEHKARATDIPVGHMELSDEDISELENEDITDWFKGS